ncbi:hypothetical protein [Empedobacter stercoris]|uniref:hypothetical protein n=1 Tax=Empedobacter stercoris TaxID=1628248 RepID=UPI0039EA181D
MINYIIKEKVLGKKSAVSAIITGCFINEKPNDKIKIALGVSVTPEMFGTPANKYNYNKDQIQNGRTYEINILRNKIHQIEDKLQLVLNFYLLSGITPTKSVFEEKLLSILINDGIIIKKNFTPKNVHYLDEHLESLIFKERDLIEKNFKTSDSKYKTYNTLLSHIYNYQDYIKTRLVIEEIKVATILDFVDTTNKITIGEIKIENNHVKSNKTIRNKEGYSLNSINILIANFKSVLRQVDSDVVQINCNLSDKRLKKQKVQNAKKIYLNTEILEKIYNHKPLKNKTQRAKDYILLASCSGMRYQSVALLHKYTINEITTREGEVFSVVQNTATKTNITILSPCFKIMREIYERNGNKFPKIMFSQRLSEAMRELLSEVGINYEVAVNEWIYGKGIVSKMETIDTIITSHDNRKSFVTNLLQLGVSSSIVRSMTHENIEENSSSFNIYDNASAIDRAITFYEATKNLNSVIYRY